MSSDNKEKSGSGGRQGDALKIGPRGIFFNHECNWGIEAGNENHRLRQCTTHLDFEVEKVAIKDILSHDI